MSSASNEILIRDTGTLLKIGFDDCVKYHGRSSIGGLALGFRLVQLAFADLLEGRHPDRREISVATSFGGPGFRDAIEMVTRSLTRGVYTVDAALATPTAPESPAGPLWFKVAIGELSACYEVVAGAVGEEFVRLGKKSRAGTLTEQEAPLWTAQKEGLAAALMAGAPGAYLRRV